MLLYYMASAAEHRPVSSARMLRLISPSRRSVSPCFFLVVVTGTLLEETRIPRAPPPAHGLCLCGIGPGAPAFYDAARQQLWRSNYFRETYSMLSSNAYLVNPLFAVSPLTVPVHRIRYKIYGMHSWCRGGRYRKATDDKEVVEHYWDQKRDFRRVHFHQWRN
jgi:hypothetical protein